MNIRPAASGDHDAIAAIVEAAFGDEGPSVARIVRDLRADPAAYVPELEYVATIGDAVVGHVMFTWASLEPGRRVLSLSPLAVARAHQRRGIGDALTRRGIADIESRREPLVMVLGHPSYYPKFGFEPALANGIEPPAEAMRSDAFMVLKLSAYDDSWRGRIVYPPAFDGA